MQILLELNEEQSARLQELARKLSVEPAELAKAACTDLLTQTDDGFHRAATHVLQKNRELYERLS